MGFRVLPPVVKNLLILNVIFFVATYFFSSSIGVDLIDKFGLRYFAAEKFAPYQFITYMFMHGGFTHILFNMFALWMFGYSLENLWGPKKFLIYYFVTGIGAALVHYITIYLTLQPDLALLNQFLSDPSVQTLNNLINNHRFQINQASGDIWLAFTAFQANVRQLSTNPDNFAALQGAIDFVYDYKAYYLNLPNVVGASGAVFGILLAFGMIFPNTVIYLYFAIPVKAKYFVIFYGLLELYLGFTRTSSNIAHFAHLGGMIFGYFLIVYWRYKDKRKFF
ncbi:MAG TPA: rhomboid family intramembrane serine protease [Bacteroidales bacterium]|nr:rhomboid family intramembrane serine protease [Bacteroidales bacterium]